MGLYHLIYQSRALVPFSAPELAQLLKQARAHNRQLLVTGLLLHSRDGRFLQVLEGEDTDVRPLYHHHIRSDPRHYHCEVLGEGPCAERSFAKWDMDFRVAQGRDITALLQRSTLPSPAGPGTHAIPPELLHLLLDFVDTKALPD